MRRRRNESRFSLFAFQDIITSVTGIMILITLVLAIELIERTESSPRQKTVETIEQLESQVAENEKEISRLEAQRNASLKSTPALAALDAETLRRRLRERREQNQTLVSRLARAQRERSEAKRRNEKIEKQDQQSRATEEQQRNNLKQQVNETRRKIQKLVAGKRVVFNPSKGFSRTPWVVEISAAGVRVAPMGRAGATLSFAGAAAFQNWARSRSVSSEYMLLVVKPDGIATFQTIKEDLRSRGFSIGFDLIGADQTAVDSTNKAATP